MLELRPQKPGVKCLEVGENRIVKKEPEGRVKVLSVPLNGGGGAIIFGPRPRDYFYRQPSKKMVLGIRHALWSHLKNDTLHVAESLAVSSRKTKEIVSLLKKWNFQPGMERILLVDAALTEEMYYSYRNIPGLEILLPHQINPYDLILADKLVISQAAFPLISRFLEGGGDGSL